MNYKETFTQQHKLNTDHPQGNIWSNCGSEEAKPQVPYSTHNERSYTRLHAV